MKRFINKQNLKTNLQKHSTFASKVKLSRQVSILTNENFSSSKHSDI